METPGPGEAGNADKSIVREREAAMQRYAGRTFKTEKGWTYTYDDRGRTTRQQAETGHTHAPQDLTVFVEMNVEEKLSFAAAMHAENDDPASKEKVYVVERGSDNQPRIVESWADITDPSKLSIAIVRDGKMLRFKPVTLRPRVGSYVFDTRLFRDRHGKSYKERHLGHRVTEV
ncbi:MAG: hypothetical protein U0514_01470 [Candidatus Andersenbacteria bacterium]